MQNSKVTVKTSFGIGNVIAVVISWSVNHSIFWAAVHGVFGWLYVIYYFLTK